MTITEDRQRLESRRSVVLKAYREHLNVSRRELVSRMGWTRNVIANLEAERMKPVRRGSCSHAKDLRYQITPERNGAVSMIGHLSA